ncbi:MAG TPA: hypothetical protein VMM55_09860 [Thermohalobaculum sp.]|nr:hypothetical protein [Thermohalobaculum sp.]
MNARLTILAVALGLCGLMLLAHLAVLLGATGRGSRYLYIEVDQAGFLVLALLVVLATAVACLSPRTLSAVARLVRLDRFRPWAVAGAVLVLTLIGTPLVHHGFAFTMDEFMTRFQGEVFVEGRLTGRFPPEWRPFGHALMPVYVYLDQATGTVASSYRPGMALIYALFDLAALGPYSGAFLAAGSVLMTAAIARRIWPGDAEAAAVAALLVGTSQQVLALALTSYAMPAHLFFNLLWLWLFLGNTRAGHLLAPFVGVFTAALHQVHIHALFALPFLLMLLRPFRPGLVVWYGAVYAAGHLLILNWGAFMPDAGAVRSGGPPADLGSAGPFLEFVLRVVRLPGLDALGSVFVNLVRFVAWQSPALVPLLLLLLARRAPRPPILALLAASAALSFAPYPFMVPDPQHGWGYRYLHGVIGNVALLATAGWIALRAAPSPGRHRYRGFVLLLLLVAPAVMIPLRAVRIEAVVGAYADATAFVERQESTVVVIDPYRIFYGRDLRRNDPFLRNRPVVLTLDAIPKALLEDLCADHSVSLVTAEDVAPFGVPTFTAERATAAGGLPPDYRDWLATLRAPDCAAD